jgi:DivIVA domain-containing protein
MSTVLLVLVVVLVVAGLVYGVVSLLAGDDPGLVPVDPDGVARPLPNNRSLSESDLKTVRFDVELRGYRMSQVDRVLRRTAYDVGYKDEMIAVLEAEVIALREGRLEDADLLQKARESASSTAPVPAAADTQGGAHRADDEALGGDEAGTGDDAADSDWSPADDVEDSESEPAVSSAGSSVDDADVFPGTGAGRLNRAALRRVDDEPDPDDTAAEPTPVDPVGSLTGTADDVDLVEAADADEAPPATTEPTTDATAESLPIAEPLPKAESLPTAEPLPDGAELDGAELDGADSAGEVDAAAPAQRGGRA